MKCSGAARYWSKDQVQELFFGLGLAGKKMGPKDFKRFMMDIQRYLPSPAGQMSLQTPAKTMKRHAKRLLWRALRGEM